MDVNGTVETMGDVGGRIETTGEVRGRLSNSGSVVVNDYNRLNNKPSIEGNVLEGDKTFKQLGMDTLSVQEIEKILYL